MKIQPQYNIILKGNKGNMIQGSSNQEQTYIFPVNSTKKKNEFYTIKYKEWNNEPYVNTKSETMKP